MKTLISISCLLFSFSLNAQWTKAYPFAKKGINSCVPSPQHIGVYNIKYSDDIYLLISNGDTYQISPTGKVWGKRRLNWNVVEHYPVDPRFTILQIQNGPTQFIAKLDKAGDIDKSVHVSVEQLSQNNDIIGAISRTAFYCLDTNLNILHTEVFGDEVEINKFATYNVSNSIIPNEIGGFTFTARVEQLIIQDKVCFKYPIIFKTDSTCQIQALQMFDPNVVKKNAGSREVRIFPNPSNGIFNVSGGFKLVKVYDSIGRFIKQSRDRRIDLTQHPDGMYFFRVGESTFKVIKQ